MVEENVRVVQLQVILDSIRDRIISDKLTSECDFNFNFYTLSSVMSRLVFVEEEKITMGVEVPMFTDFFWDLNKCDIIKQAILSMSNKTDGENIKLKAEIHEENKTAVKMINSKTGNILKTWEIQHTVPDEYSIYSDTPIQYLKQAEYIKNRLNMLE